MDFFFYMLVLKKFKLKSTHVFKVKSDELAVLRARGISAVVPIMILDE